MGPRHALLLAALLLPAFAVSRAEAHAWCEPVPAPGAFDRHLTQLYACSHVPPFMLAYMWSPVQIQIQCPTSWYSVYKGDSQELLRRNVKERNTAFCGWERFVDGRKCRFQMSPFWQTYVGISDGSSACRLTASIEFSPQMMVAAVIGVGLFYMAPHLTSSIVFRLGCGSLLFTLGSLIILVFIIMRHVPYKRTAGVALGVMGTSGMAVARWLTGHWIPSWTQLSQNPVFQAYVLASALMGAGLSYWFDDRTNPKLNALILAALRTAALALVYYGTWVMPVAFAGVSGVLLTSLISPQIQANMESTRVQVQRVTTATAALIMSPFTHTPRPGSAAARSAAPAAAPPTTGSPGVFGGFSFWGSSSAAKRKWERELEEERARRIALGLPTFDEPDLADLTPLHLKTPPPDPWSLVVKPREAAQGVVVVPFEQKMSQALARQQRRRGAAGASGSVVSAQDGANTSTVASAGGPSAPASAGGVGADSGSGVMYILNPMSGRQVKIGGDTYLKLLEDGWEPDLTHGVMFKGSIGEAGSGRGAGASGRASSGLGRPRRSPQHT